MEKTMSVLELLLLTEEGQVAVLNKKIECVRSVYNATLGKAWSVYQQITNSKEYRSNQETLKLYYKEKEEGKIKKIPEEIKGIFDKRNDLYKASGLTKFGIYNLARNNAKHYQKNVSSIIAQMSIGDPVWASIQKVMFGNGNKVSFKRKGEINSFASNGKSGIRLVKEDNEYFLVLSNHAAGAKTMKIRINPPKNTYEEEMLARTIKVIRIVRKRQGNTYRFFVQFTVEGNPYNKLNEDGSKKHKIGTGKVGLVIRGNQVCAVADGVCKTWMFDDRHEEYTEKIEKLSQEISRILKLNNPDNYNADGTNKKGRHEWYHSNKYNALVNSKRELMRKKRETRNIRQHIIANEILEMGNEIYLQKKSYVTKKEKFDEENKRSNKEYQRLKERRVYIQDFAPAALIGKINQKLKKNGCNPVHEITIPKEITYYCHDTKKSDKSKYIEGFVVFKGVSYREQPYRALCVMNYDGKKFDDKQIEKGLQWLM